MKSGRKKIDYKAIMCAIFGHPRVADYFWGYQNCARCARCGYQFGDSLGGIDLLRMNNILHKLGIHEWEYQTPTSEKIKERLPLVDMFGRVNSDRDFVGYAYFQKGTCKICGKVKMRGWKINTQ